MSITLSYQPVAEEKIINGATSGTVKALEDVFGILPRILTEDDLLMLHAMAAASSPFESVCPFSQILDAVRQHRTIRISAN